MKLKILLTVLSFLALISMDRASAILINIDPLSIAKSQALAPNGVANTGLFAIPVGSGDFAPSTGAGSTGNGIAQAHANWNFTNTPTQATWSSSQVLNSNVQPGFENLAGTANNEGLLRFTLNEIVDYSITGSFFVDSLNVGSGAEFFGQLFNVSTSTLVWREDKVIIPDSPTIVASFPWSGNETGSLTGQLLPGTYRFQTFNTIHNITGIGTSNFALTLSTPSVDTHVPDAGSTLAMLGMALGAIGFARRMV